VKTKKGIKALAGLAVLVVLTGCSAKSDRQRTPTEPVWFSTTSPSGLSVECVFVGDYGGIVASSFQAEMQCWETK